MSVTPFVRLRRLGYRSAYMLLRGYWLLRQPQLRGVKCVLTAGELILLVRHTYGPREWDLPGGSIKRGESPADAAKREMREELGIAIDWTPFGEVTGRMHHRRDRMFCFRAPAPRTPLVFDLGELAGAKWFAPDRLPASVGHYTRQVLGLTPIR